MNHLQQQLLNVSVKIVISHLQIYTREPFATATAINSLLVKTIIK
jgi:hypothetical protein